MPERNAGHFARLNAFLNLDQIAERLLDEERIVAVGLLTRHDLNQLGPTFTRVWPVDDAPDFDQLLRAIDEADRDLNRSRNRGPERRE